MSRIPLAIAAVLLLAIVGAAVFLASRGGDPVYFRMIDSPEDALDASRLEWMRQKDLQKGVHLYELEASNPYELLFYDNVNHGLNLYRTSTLRATLQDGVLRLAITEEDAVDDAYVNDRILAYFIIKEQPIAIEVYRNGENVPLLMESGREQISQ
jgi:hypothetical protein